MKILSFYKSYFDTLHTYRFDDLQKLEILEFYFNEISDYNIFIRSRCGLCITNCPNLTQLEIGDHSFGDFKSFELSNLNSIQSIKFGDFCFKYADFSLKGE